MRGLRKTGSSSAVADTTARTSRTEDLLARSASSPRLAPDKCAEVFGEPCYIMFELCIGGR